MVLQRVICSEETYGLSAGCRNAMGSHAPPLIQDCDYRGDRHSQIFSSRPISARTGSTASVRTKLDSMLECLSAMMRSHFLVYLLSWGPDARERPGLSLTLNSSRAHVSRRRLTSQCAKRVCSRAYSIDAKLNSS